MLYMLYMYMLYMYVHLYEQDECGCTNSTHTDSLSTELFYSLWEVLQLEEAITSDAILTTCRDTHYAYRSTSASEQPPPAPPLQSTSLAALYLNTAYFSQ